MVEYKDSETEFEDDDDMDTDKEALFENGEKALDEAEEDPWNVIIAKAFKECQFKYEDRVKEFYKWILRTLTNGQLDHLHLSSGSPCIKRLLLAIS